LENINLGVKSIIRQQIKEREWDKKNYDDACERQRLKALKRRHPEEYNSIQQNATVCHGIPQNANSNSNNNILSKDNIKKDNNKLLSKEKEKIPSVSELLKLYESNELLVWRIKDSQAVREWLEYKQKKKDRAYKSEKAFIQRLAWIVKTLDNWIPRTDIWERLSYAVNIATEKEWKDIYRTEQTELDYQSFKRFNSMQWTNKLENE
jgi:hypothetical protein